MSFSFNFMPDEQQDGSKEDASPDEVKENPPQDISHPFVWKTNLESLLEDRSQQEIVFQEVELAFDEPDSEEPLRRVCMEQYEKEVTPGIYEGGLQVWECSLDLVRYFQDNNNLNLENGSSGLELGCGHALPGCWLLRQALLQQQKEQSSTNIAPPFQMVFVDYNDYVIDDVTLSNIVLNSAGIVEAKSLAERQLIRLGSGDWNDMSRQLQDRRFDWIVAAETTYTPRAAQETAELLLKHLTIETGVGWIASKRYYFGVGGGTDALREAAQKLSSQSSETHHLTVETVKVLDSGAGNIREILKVTCHAKKEDR